MTDNSTVTLTETELNDLTVMATRDQVISATFGTPGHGVRVDLSDPCNKWMIKPLAEMRGVIAQTDW